VFDDAEVCRFLRVPELSENRKSFVSGDFRLRCGKRQPEAMSSPEHFQQLFLLSIDFLVKFKSLLSDTLFGQALWPRVDALVHLHASYTGFHVFDLIAREVLRGFDISSTQLLRVSRSTGGRLREVTPCWRWTQIDQVIFTTFAGQRWLRIVFKVPCSPVLMVGNRWHVSLTSTC